jgi:hypothetical protein
MLGVGHWFAPNRKRHLLPDRHGTCKLIETLFEPREGVQKTDQPAFRLHATVDRLRRSTDFRAPPFSERLRDLYIYRPQD